MADCWDPHSNPRTSLIHPRGLTGRGGHHPREVRSAFHGLPSLFQGWPSIVGPMNLMAVTSRRARTWSPGRVPNRFLLLGLALALAVGGAYAALGNPFARSQATPAYQTTAAALGTVQVTV